jgi:hypothetical protein
VEGFEGIFRGFSVERSSEVAMGGREGGVERPILRIYQPEKKGARSAAKATSKIEEVLRPGNFFVWN